MRALAAVESRVDRTYEGSLLVRARAPASTMCAAGQRIVIETKKST
jgi:hypothetical protein